MPKFSASFVAILMLLSACSGESSEDATPQVSSDVSSDSNDGDSNDTADAEGSIETDGSEDSTDTEGSDSSTISVSGTAQTSDGGVDSEDDDADAPTGTAGPTTTSSNSSDQTGDKELNATVATTPTRQTTAPTGATTGPNTPDATDPTIAGTTTTGAPVGSNGAMNWGLDASKPAGSWSKPSLNQIYQDPAYETELRRVTSAAGTRFDRNTYSRRQAENANGSLFMTYHGSARYHVYSVANAGLVRALTIGADSEPQWHPTDPAKVRHLAGSNSSNGALQLLETNVNTGNETIIADFASDVKARIPQAAYVKDRAEGSPSKDGNRWAWIVYDDNEDIKGIMSYDLATGAVLGTATDLISENLDWVSMSPTGRYVLAGYWEGTYIYDANMTNRRLVTPAGEHSDVALDRNGNDTYVYIDFSSPSPTAGWLTAVDLATLKRTKIFDLYDDANTSLHISGKGYDKPGWVVVSSYNCKEPGAWSCEKVMAVELADGGRVLNLAHTYNCGDGYWTETHAVVNRSFDAVYFNSDGGSCGIDAEVYRLDIPSFN